MEKNNHFNPQENIDPNSGNLLNYFRLLFASGLLINRPRAVQLAVISSKPNKPYVKPK